MQYLSRIHLSQSHVGSSLQIRMAPPILGYWRKRCLAQPIRLILAYVEEEFVDEFYDIVQTGPNEFDDSGWMSKKENLGFDFPNLPYYIDGDVRITQSTAIIDYISLKHNLIGKDLQEQGTVAMLKNEFVEMRDAFVDLCYSSEDVFASGKNSFLESTKKKLGRISKFLGDKTWLVGEKVTAPDIILYDLLDSLRLMEPSILTDFSNLSALITRFEALPTIKAYMNSDRFIAWPLHNMYASFGGNPRKM